MSNATTETTSAPEAGEGRGGTDRALDRLDPLRGWASPARLAAIVLYGSALLKAHELATGPAAGTGILSSRWFLTALVDFELLLATWLASGVGAAAARWTAIGTFFVFSGASLASLVNGGESCGCFGRVKVHPGYTLVLDLALLVALLRSRPRVAGGGGRAFWPRAGVAAAVFAGLAAPMTVTIVADPSGSITAGGELTGTSGLVLLEPEEWPGKPFPLLRHIDIDADLGRGEWLVVFHRHGCSSCAEAVPVAIEWAERESGRDGSPRVAFVEVPPLERAGRLHVEPREAYSSGSLREGVDWFIQTPRVVRVSGGVVGAIEDPEAFFHKRTAHDGDD